MNITKEQADKVNAALEMNHIMAADAEGNYTREVTPKIILEALSIMRGLEDAEPVPKTWHKVGYYHKAETADECDFFFLDAINGDCPDCHPCYTDTAALEKPSPQAAQTEAGLREVVRLSEDMGLYDKDFPFKTDAAPGEI